MNKTERRHELQQNELAAYLEKVNKQIEPYSKPILGVVLVVMAVGIGWSFYSSEQEADSSFATLELIKATSVQMIDPEDLDTVEFEFLKTSAGKLAKLYQGLALVNEGNDLIYEDTESATETLKEGIEVLTSVAEGNNDPLIKSRAYLGIALAQTTLGDTEAAVAAYEEVEKADESEAMVEYAANRIATLTSTATKEFSDWFKNTSFAVATPANPDPSLPPSERITSIDSFLPDLGTPSTDSDTKEKENPLTGEATPRDLDGGLDLPKVTDSAAPADTTEATDSDSETTPAASPETPEPVAPSDAESSATEAPAEAETESSNAAAEAPAEQAPAVEAPADDK